VVPRNDQRIGSGVIIGDRVYLLNESGFAQCIEAATGKQLWRARASTRSWSSTEFVDGKLYSSTQDGTSFVWKPGDKFELLHENKMEEHMNASLAFSDGQVFVRTYKALYCVGKRKA
jgi:outer membrane protein assembly factor BamB